MLIFSILLPVFFWYFLIKIHSNKPITPSGYGICFLPIIILYNYQNNIIEDYYLYIFIFFGLVYFYDDYINIKIIYRLLLQFISILIIIFYLNLDVSFLVSISIIILFILSVNFVNFQDGADLNFFFISLISIYNLSHFDLLDFNNDFVILVCVFLFLYGIFNFIKKKIYIGDSGIYIFVTLYFYFFLKDIDNYSAYLLPLIPIFLDCSYVIIKRSLNNSNIFSRNYEHMYQIIQIKFNKKLYLIPLFYFYFLNLFIFNNLNNFQNIHKILIVIIFNFLNYLIVRYLLYKFEK